jgi:hypothetical protein
VSTLRFPDPALWQRIETHLTGGPGAPAQRGADRFAFAFTRILPEGTEGPVLIVEDVELIGDHDVAHGPSGWTITGEVLDRVHHRAVVDQQGLVQFHHHQLGPPRLTGIDPTGLLPTADHLDAVLDDDRPYGAVVWSGGTVHAEWFRRRTGLRGPNAETGLRGPNAETGLRGPNAETGLRGPNAETGGVQRGTFRSVTVVGDHLRLLNARWSDEDRFRRQVPILGRSGQAVLRRLRVAVVGQGGTGSHAVTQLAYLGVRDLVLLDDDVVDPTSLNRVVTAEPADVGAPKTTVARRRVRAIDHEATVRVLPGLIAHRDPLDLPEVDLVIGCVDDDGPRHKLNRLAVDAALPYLDIGTGVDADLDPAVLGARLSFVLPGGPCLTCTAELDPTEVARWHQPPSRRGAGRPHGYGDPGGDPSPSVVYLNGLAVSTALAEVVAWITGSRPPALRVDIDVNGDPARPGTRLSPSGDRTRRPDCVDCS